MTTYKYGQKLPKKVEKKLDAYIERIKAIKSKTMTTCAQCGEEMERYGNAGEFITVVDFVVTGRRSLSVGVCTKPECPSFNLLQRYSDED